jgi:hypothetical protein
METPKDKYYWIAESQYLERFKTALMIYDQFILEIGQNQNINGFGDARRHMDSLSESFTQHSTINVASKYKALCECYKKALKEDIVHRDLAYVLLCTAKAHCDIFFYEFYVKKGKVKVKESLAE